MLLKKSDQLTRKLKIILYIGILVCFCLAISFFIRSYQLTPIVYNTKPFGITLFNSAVPLIITLIGIWIYLFLQNIGKIGGILMISGALSNSIEYHSFGSVVDYIPIPYIAYINSADIALYCGTILILYSQFKTK